MYTPDQISATAKNGVDSLYSLTQTQLSAIEKLGALNFEFLKNSLESSVLTTKALFDVRGVQDLVTLGTATAQPSIDKFVAYSRSVYGVTSEAQTQMGALLKIKASELNTQAEDAIDTLAKSGMPGSETTAAGLKSALAASQSAYESLNKASKQASDFVEASIDAVTPKATV